MDLREPLTNNQSQVPPDRRTDDAGAEMVVPRMWISEHDDKVFRYGLHHYTQRVLGSELLLHSKDFVHKNGLIARKGKVLGISVEQELKSCLHGFLAREFCTRQILQDRLPLLLVELPSLDQSWLVVFGQFKPPVRLKLSQS